MCYKSLLKCFGLKINTAHLPAMVQDASSDGDDELNFDEFVCFMENFDEETTHDALVVQIIFNFQTYIFKHITFLNITKMNQMPDKNFFHFL